MVRDNPPSLPRPLNSLDQAIETLRQIRADLREIKETMSTKDDIERILRHIDGFAARPRPQAP